MKRTIYIHFLWITILLLILIISIFIHPICKEGLNPLEYDTDIVNMIPDKIEVDSSCIFPILRASALNTLTTYVSKNKDIASSDINLVKKIIPEITTAVKYYIYNPKNPNPLLDFQNSTLIQPFQFYKKQYHDSSSNILQLQIAIGNNMMDVYNSNINKCASGITLTPPIEKKVIAPTPPVTQTLSSNMSIPDIANLLHMNNESTITNPPNDVLNAINTIR